MVVALRPNSRPTCNTSRSGELSGPDAVYRRQVPADPDFDYNRALYILHEPWNVHN